LRRDKKTQSSRRVFSGGKKDKKNGGGRRRGRDSCRWKGAISRKGKALPKKKEKKKKTISVGTASPSLSRATKREWNGRKGALWISEEKKEDEASPREGRETCRPPTEKRKEDAKEEKGGGGGKGGRPDAERLRSSLSAVGDDTDFRKGKGGQYKEGDRVRPGPGSRKDLSHAFEEGPCPANPGEKKPITKG